MVQITKAKWENVGFKTNSVIMCHTPEYSEDLPLAYVVKQWIKKKRTLKRRLEKKLKKNGKKQRDK